MRSNTPDRRVKPMPSLLDIAPPELSAEEIDIRGTKLRVSGIVAEDWAALYARFPTLRLIVSGRSGDTVSPVELLGAQAGLIAAGLGQIGNAEIEHAVVERLGAEDQKAIVEAIMRLSMPGHIFSPLLGAGAPAGDASGKAAATK